MGEKIPKTRLIGEPWFFKKEGQEFLALSILPLAAGLEERELALVRNDVGVALRNLVEPVPGSVGQGVLVFTQPGTFDLVPLALRWGWKVAVLSDDPKAEALRDLLENLPDSIKPKKENYAIGITSASLMLDRFEQHLWIKSQQEGLRLLGLPAELKELPAPVASALEATRSFLDLAA